MEEGLGMGLGMEGLAPKLSKLRRHAIAPTNHRGPQLDYEMEPKELGC